MALAEDHDVREELAPADSCRSSARRFRSAKDCETRAQEIPLREAGIPCGDEAFPCPLDPFTSQPLDVARVPDEAANAQDVAIDTFPDSDLNYDTIQFAGSRRFNQRFFVQGSFDYQWRDELKNAATDLRIPLFSDPIIPDGYTTYWQNHSLDTARRQPSTTWQARFLVLRQSSVGGQAITHLRARV